MRYKILFFLFFLFFLMYLIISHLNPENVKLCVGYGKCYENGVADFVVISFILGVIISIIISFFHDIKSTFAGWMEGKKDKKREEYRETIEKAMAYDHKGDREKAIESLNRLVFPNVAL